MAFPEDYEENPAACVARGWDHEWVGNNHPLKNTCKHCHKPQWIQKREIYIPNPLGYHF